MKSIALHVFAGCRGWAGELPVVDRAMSEGAGREIDRLVCAAAGYVLLADCRGADDLQRLDIALSVAEARSGLAAGLMAIVASIDSAAGLMQLPALGGRSTRLAGLTWDRSRLAADMGADREGNVAAYARIQVLVAARAFGLPAYDSILEPEPHRLAEAQAFGFDGYRLV